RIETYVNSSPIIHSVFHNSVENQGAQNAVKRLVRHICQRLKFCGQFSCGYWLKIRSMEPIPNEVDEPKQRNSDQDARHEEGPIVFWFSVHPKLGSVGLCRCGLQIRSLRTSRKVVRKQKFFDVFDGQQISQTTFVLDFGSKGANNSRSKKFALCRCQRTAEGK